MNILLRQTLGVLLLGASLHAAQAADLGAHPGAIDPGQLSFIDGRQPNVEVTLTGPVLKMLLQLPIKYDEKGQVQDLLKVVEQVVVRIYTLDEKQARDVLGYIAETSQDLEKKNWQRIVRVRESENENVDIHVKVSDDGENLNGLVIMAVDNSGDDGAEMVFVNIAGNFNPAYLANIGGQFDINYLEGVKVP